MATSSKTAERMFKCYAWFSVDSRQYTDGEYKYIESHSHSPFLQEFGIEKSRQKK
jgi:hypothetical protein